MCVITAVAQSQSSNSTLKNEAKGTAGVEETLSAAQDKLAHGKPQEAIAMLQKLVPASGPSPKGVQHELGIAYYRTGKLIDADKAFAHAIEQDPNDVEAVQMRGLTLYRLGRQAEAIPYLERVKQWTPNANADANYVLGLCYINTNRFDDARVAFANQFSVPPNSGAAYLLLAKMLMEVNLPQPAAEAAKKALEVSPNLPQAHFMLGEYYLFKSDTDSAQKEFEQERAISPANFAVYDRLGDVYTRAGQYQNAQESLAKAIALETSSTGPFIQMGKVLLRRNDPQTALLYLEHAEKMDPSNYMTHTLLGQAYRSLGRDDEARKQIDIAAKIHATRQVRSPQGQTNQ